MSEKIKVTIDTIVNLTPDKVTLLDENDEVIGDLPPSGLVARAGAITVQVGEFFDNFPITETKYTSVHIVDGQGRLLPSIRELERDGVFVIVSKIVAEVATKQGLFKNRILLVGQTVREGSTILGCKSLSLFG